MEDSLFRAQRPRCSVCGREIAREEFYCYMYAEYTCEECMRKEIRTADENKMCYYCGADIPANTPYYEHRTIMRIYTDHCSKCIGGHKFNDDPRQYERREDV